MKGIYQKSLTCILSLICVLAPLSSFAAVQIENPLKADSFAELLDMVINFIFIMSLGITPIIIIIAGFLFITAMGDPQKIQTAKRVIIWALIGLTVVLCAKGLVNLFKEVFKVGP
jgi:hypothetical protein